MRELPFYTSLFRIERKMYAINGVALPRPVSVVKLFVFLAAFAITVLVGQALGISPMQPVVGALYIAVPALAAGAVGRDLHEGRGTGAWAASGWRLLSEPKRLHGLDPDREPDRVTFRVTAWSALDEVATP
jgi:hypothetical protein